jgi:hypothetical protein
MFRTRRELLLTSLILPRLTRAAARWLDRKPAEWTPDDIQTVLNRSAWVHEVPFEFSVSDEPTTKKSKQAEGRLSRVTDFTVLVRWESGLPVRLARRTASLPDAGMDHYVVSVSRLPVAFLADASGHHLDQSLIKADIATQLAASTLIERSGKSAIRAAHAEWLEADFSPRVVVSFPPSQERIELTDWEAIVVGQIGPLTFRAPFPLRPMVYHGKLEL